MASLYQRFSGKINTGTSFPNPPEASHLLGQSAEVEQQRPALQPRLQPQQQLRRRPEDEDVRKFFVSTPVRSNGV